MQIGESVILVKGLYHAPGMDQWIGQTVKVGRACPSEPDHFYADDLTISFKNPYSGKTEQYLWEYAPCKAEYDRQMAAKGNTGTPSGLAYSGIPITWDPMISRLDRDTRKTVAPSSAGGGCQHDLIPSACDHGRPWCRKCGYKPENAEVRP